METIKYVSDYDKVKKIDRKDLEKIVHNIATVSHSFNKMNGELGCSLFEWFRAFVLSPEFQSLERKKQNEIFEHYDYASYAIKEIDELMYENQLGEVWNTVVNN